MDARKEIGPTADILEPGDVISFDMYKGSEKSELMDKSPKNTES